MFSHGERDLIEWMARKHKEFVKEETLRFSEYLNLWMACCDLGDDLPQNADEAAKAYNRRYNEPR